MLLFLRVLCRYYDQLTAMDGKLPIAENQVGFQVAVEVANEKVVYTLSLCCCGKRPWVSS